MKRVLRVFVVSFSVLILIGACGTKATRPAGFDPERSLKEAQEAIDDYEFENARRLLMEIRNRDTTGRYAPLAQLKIAESYIEEGQIDRAIESYREFIRLYPDHPQAPYAQYQIGMLYFNQIKDPERGSGIARKAMQEFKRLLEMFPRNPYAVEVKLKIEQCKHYLSEYEFIVGMFYYKKGSCRAAIGRFKGLIENYPESRRVPEAMFLMADCYLKQGDPQVATVYLKKLLSMYPDTKIAERAREKLKKISADN